VAVSTIGVKKAMTLNVNSSSHHANKKHLKFFLSIDSLDAF